MALTLGRVRKLTTPGRYHDERGLYLQVASTTNRSWLLRFEREGRERWMGLGSAATFNLAEARERARRAKQLLADGQDPIEARLAARDAQRKEEAERITFKEAAEKYLVVHEPGWRSLKHRQQWNNTLLTYAYPTLGARPCKAIDAALINQALQPIWTTIPETAARVRHRIERVIQWVKDGSPLPKQAVSKRQQHHPALPYRELPAFMEELRQRPGMSALALQFLILTAARTGEVIGARRDEFDFEQKLWTVPAERMKGNRVHRVPLSGPAIKLLQALPTEKGNDFMFVGATRGRGLSNMALLELMRGMRPGFVPHGLRATFRTWAAERTSFPGATAEAALAHASGDKLERTYQRGDMLQKRQKLMDAFAQYCETKPAEANGTVIALRAKA